MKTKTYDDLIAEGYEVIDEHKIWIILGLTKGKIMYRIYYDIVTKTPIMKVKYIEETRIVCKHI